MPDLPLAVAGLADAGCWARRDPAYGRQRDTETIPGPAGY
jgi:hypothetical protein